MRTILQALGFMAFAFSLWAADPFVGTWKLNLAKSDFNPGHPKNISQTLQIRATNNGLRVVMDGVDSQQKIIHTDGMIKFDHTSYPLLVNAAENVASYMNVSIKRIDKNTIHGTIKLAGREIQSGWDVVSEDGMTMTSSSEGISTDGTRFLNILVYDKQ